MKDLKLYVVSEYIFGIYIYSIYSYIQYNLWNLDIYFHNTDKVIYIVNYLLIHNTLTTIIKPTLLNFFVNLNIHQYYWYHLNIEITYIFN